MDKLERKLNENRLTLAFIAVTCFWLGYQAACFDIEMTGSPKDNLFSPYTEKEDK